MRRISVIPAVLLLLLFMGASGAGAQGGSAGAELQAARTDLGDLLRRLQYAAQAPDSSDVARARASLAARTVQTRLAEGDFRTGDRIVIRVESDPPPPAFDRAGGQGRPADQPMSVEQQLSDTFTVGTGRSITLPVLGPVSLRGVLRSELEPYLTRQIGRYIRDPVVHARSLIRLAIVGAVTHPGFYSLPADAIFADAVMAAGGATQDAKVDKMRIERAGRRLLEGAPLQQAMTEGRTLDEMNLQAGDRFIVPERSRNGAEDTVRIVAILLGIPVTVYTLTRIF